MCSCKGYASRLHLIFLSLACCSSSLLLSSARCCVKVSNCSSARLLTPPKLARAALVDAKSLRSSRAARSRRDASYASCQHWSTWKRKQAPRSWWVEGIERGSGSEVMASNGLVSWLSTLACIYSTPPQVYTALVYGICHAYMPCGEAY